MRRASTIQSRPVIGSAPNELLADTTEALVRRIPHRGLLGGADFQQLDFEDQRGAARNRGGASLVAVGDVRGTGQDRFAANLNALHAFGPALDHTVERELSWRVALVGTIEFGAVDQRAAVVDFHRVGGFGRFAGANLQFAIDQAGLGLYGPGFGGGLGQVSRGRRLFSLRYRCRAGGHQGLNLRRPLAQFDGGFAGRGIGDRALHNLDFGRGQAERGERTAE